MRSGQWRAHLKDLATVESAEAPFVSIYLDLRPDGDAKRQSLTFLHDALREHTKSEPYHGVDRRGFEGDLGFVAGYMGDFAGGRYDPASQGIAFFMSGARGIRQVIELPVPVPNRFVVGARPLLVPLGVATSAEVDYLSALVDTDSCRIFTVSSGRVVESDELEGDTADLSREPREAGWAEHRFHHHIREWRTKFTKRSAELLVEVADREHPEWLVLVGEDSQRAALKRQLPRELMERIVAEEHLPVDLATEPQVLDATLPIVRRAASERAGRSAAEVITAASEGRPAATGPDATLRALEEGAVAHLVLAPDIDDVVRRCDRCGHFERGTAGGPCPGCGGALHEEALGELLLREALRQDAEITFAAEPGELGSYGGVGALLRFAITGSGR